MQRQQGFLYLSQIFGLFNPTDLHVKTDGDITRPWRTFVMSMLCVPWFYSNIDTSTMLIDDEACRALMISRHIDLDNNALSLLQVSQITLLQNYLNKNSSINRTYVNTTWNFTNKFWTIFALKRNIFLHDSKIKKEKCLISKKNKEEQINTFYISSFYKVLTSCLWCHREN